MFVSAINSIRGTAPVRKTARIAKVGKRAAAEAEDKVGKVARLPAKDTGRNRQAAPKSAAAMSSAAVQAALTFLKPGV
ncbi:hypothetical protein [Methyloferula stellata]|uniref:hypothetical protein n=1 Tax=Methyloferula stellata TaxID=876270 RepID=UPI00037A5837|nr:hypothetical protein [Methyloferula stellata]